MIKVSWDWAIAGYCSFSIFLVIVIWIFYNYKKHLELNVNGGKLLQCNFCMHVFYYHREAPIMTCPLCKSLIQVAEEKKGKERNGQENAEEP